MMKTLLEAYPDLKSGEYNSWWDYEVNAPNSYRDLIDTFELEVIAESHDGSYQGDSFYAFKDGDKHGFLSFGWGSCSGCDEFQACEGNVERTSALQESLYNGIIWFDSKDELVEWLANDETQRGKFYWNEDVWKQFRNLVLLNNP